MATRSYHNIMFSSQLVRMRGRGGRADISRVAVCGRRVAVSPSECAANSEDGGHGSGGAEAGAGWWMDNGGGLLETLAQLRGEKTRVVVCAEHEEFHLETITSYLGYLFKISILNETMNRPNNFYWYFLPALAAPHPLMRRGRAQSRSSDHQH